MSPKFKQEDGYTLPPPTSVSVLMINAQGMMLSVLGQDYFVSYNRVPWLRDARVSSALNVRMAGPNAIEWPELDVDLEIESLKHPERYPLVMKRSPLDMVFPLQAVTGLQGILFILARKHINQRAIDIEQDMLVLTHCLLFV